MKYHLKSRARVSQGSRFLHFLGVLALSLPLLGADKLQFGGAKTRTQPGQERSMEDTLNLRNLRAPSPYDTVLPRPMPTKQTRDLKPRERRIRNQREERKNWALLEPGQLQKDEGEEFNFGLREYDEDNIERSRSKDDKENKDYTFYGLEKGQNRKPTGSQGSRDKPGGQNASRSLSPEEERSLLEVPSNRNPLVRRSVPEAAPRQGAHVNTRLDMKNMLKPSNSRFTSKGMSEGNFNTYLGTSITGAERRQYDQRMKNFKNLINGSSPSKKPGSLSDPINMNQDLTRRSMNPVVGTASPSSPTRISQGVSLPRAQSIFRSTGRPDTTPGYNPGFSPSFRISVPGFNEFGPRLPQPKPSRLFTPEADQPKRRF